MDRRWTENKPSPGAPLPMSAPQLAGPPHPGPHALWSLPWEAPHETKWKREEWPGGRGEHLAAWPGDGRWWSRGRQGPGSRPRRVPGWQPAPEGSSRMSTPDQAGPPDRMAPEKWLWWTGDSVGCLECWAGPEVWEGKPSSSHTPDP